MTGAAAGPDLGRARQRLAMAPAAPGGGADWNRSSCGGSDDQTLLSSVRFSP